MKDGAKSQTAEGDWSPQHYGRDDRYAYSGLDLARGSDSTAWRCSCCGRDGILDKAPIDCDRWGCPAKELLP